MPSLRRQQSMPAEDLLEHGAISIHQCVEAVGPEHRMGVRENACSTPTIYEIETVHVKLGLVLGSLRPQVVSEPSKL